MFSGLSAFPLTPLRDGELDEAAFVGIIEKLAESGVDSIIALGSTGVFAYLGSVERRRAAELAVEHAGGLPLGIGISGLRLRDVLSSAQHAQDIGADALLLSAMSYTPLSADEVFGLFEAVSESTTVPIVLYDNPTTTHFHFDRELYGRISALPDVASIKIPGVPESLDAAKAHVSQIRAEIRPGVTIGVSGDPAAARGLLAGCDAWYSVLAGTLPGPAVRLMQAVRNGDAAALIDIDHRLEGLWNLFRNHGGGLRVVAAIAEAQALVSQDSLPAPLRGLSGAAREQLRTELERISDLL